MIPFEIKGLDDLGSAAGRAPTSRVPARLRARHRSDRFGQVDDAGRLVDIVNRERAGHIMTVEDPIEFLHKHKTCVVNQREVGEDTHSFATALKHVLRQDPDVILVGEMRDLETISTALTAAETGHLVFATLHTQDAPQTIDRIIDVFPPHQQQQVRVQLSTTLQGVVTQQLVPTADGKGRAVAAEVMVATPAIRNLIREGKIHQIYSAMQAGGRYGMLTMDMSLASHVKAGRDQPADGARAVPRRRGAPAADRVDRRPVGLLRRRQLRPSTSDFGSGLRRRRLGLDADIVRR